MNYIPPLSQSMSKILSKAPKAFSPIVIYRDKNQDVHAEFEPSKSTLDSRKKSPQLLEGSNAL